MKSLHNEDLEVQIKIAKLRTDLQVSATTCLSSLGLIGIFMIILHQSYLVVPENQTILKYAFMITFVLMASLFFFIGKFFIKTMKMKCKRIAELKSQYIWQNMYAYAILPQFAFKTDGGRFYRYLHTEASTKYSFQIISSFRNNMDSRFIGKLNNYLTNQLIQK